jgi:hypothetical protein
MADFIAQPVWQMPNRFLETTQQRYDELNSRYQAAVNAAEYVRSQVEQVEGAIAATNAQIAQLQANLVTVRSRFQTLSTQAQTEIDRANNAQSAVTAASATLTLQTTAIAESKTRLDNGEAIATNAQTNGQPYNAALTAIAGAGRANPGILGINSAGQWQWFAASGASFVVEFQACAHLETGQNTAGGAVTANTWTTRRINLAYDGNMRGLTGLPEDIVDETNNRLVLSAGTNRIYYFRAVALACSTDSFKTRWLIDSTGAIAQSLSTQMVADATATASRQFNLEICSDVVVPVTGSAVSLRLQSIHGAANTNTAVAAQGYPSQIAGISNCYSAIAGWRVRFI